MVPEESSVNPSERTITSAPTDGSIKENGFTAVPALALKSSTSEENGVQSNHNGNHGNLS